MEPNKITSQLIQLINKALFMEKKREFVFDGIKLYPSEIHVMLETKGEQVVNATNLAERLGITKGAISQTLTRLEKKGIIEKTKDPYSRNELSITLTEQGKKVYNLHQEMFKGFVLGIESITAQYSEKEQEAIRDFLAEVTKKI